MILVFLSFELQVNSFRMTPIQLACSLDTFNMVKLLLLYGCDLNSQTNISHPLHCYHNDDERPYFAREPLFLAATNKNVDLLKLLLKCYLRMPTRLVLSIEHLLQTSTEMQSMVRGDLKTQILDVLQNARKNPRSLMEMCRVVIRHQLGVNPRAKLDTISHLAPSQKDYICMLEELKLDSPHIYHVNW